MAIVFLQAHPDDEAVLAGATLAKAADLGIRTVVVYGTHGDAGETSQDLGGESLGDRRRREAEAACADLGVDRVEWLRYADSGMADTETNKNPDAFSNADPGRVASEVAELLADEDVRAVVGYDENGTYGHPDHIQVHRVAHALADAMDTDWVLDVTYNREFLASLPGSDGDLNASFAAAEADLTHFVEGEELWERKAKALLNHRSQMPDTVDHENPDFSGFKNRFFTEWFIARPRRQDTDMAVLDVLLRPKAEWIRPQIADAGTSGSSRPES